MRLVLDRALFDVESQAEALVLVDLFSTVARDTYSHALLTDPPYLPGGDNGPSDIWLAGRNSFEANAFRLLLTNGLLFNIAGPLAGSVSDSVQPRRWHLEGSLTVRVERRPESDWKSRKLTIADAADLLREPVHLVLENARNDLTFVRLLAGPTHGDILRKRADEPDRIVVHGGGTGEIKKWIETLLENPPTPAIWRRLLRAWVLFDNDAGDADVRELSRTAAALVKLCEEVASIHGGGLSWICLRRREIESYIPDSGLRAEALETQKSFVEHVISWRADSTRSSWAWALDLKKGLRGDLRENLPQDDCKALKAQKMPLEAHMLKAPFSGVSAGDLSTLKSGLGDRLGEALRAAQDRAWTSDLPAEYDRGPLDQAPRLSFVQSLFDRM